MDRLNNLIDRITKLPGQVSERADRVNDKAIDFARDLENALANSATTAERNLTQNKIRSLGADAASWLGQPGNLVTAGIVAAGVFFLISFLKK